MIRKCTPLLIAAYFLFLPLVSFAAVPAKVNYQGKLADSLGNPITGTVNIVFEIFDAQTGGASLWTESQTGISVAGGLFNTQLGSVTPLLESYFTGSSAWLEISVNSDPAMTPRQAITSVIYALRAGTADIAITALDADKVDGVHASDLEESVEIVNAVNTHQSNPSAHHNKTTNFSELTAGQATNGQIANNAVTSPKIADGTVAPVDVGFNYAGSSSKGGAATSAASAPWSGLTGVPAGFADGVDNIGGGGDVTAVFAGTGLNGGGVSGDLTLNVDVPLTLSGSPGPPFNNAVIIDATHNNGGVALRGISNNAGGFGVIGSSASGRGVYGESSTDVGGFFTSISGYGLIVDTGNVGIGTTAPLYKLDVSGTVNLNSGISSGVALRVNGAEALWYNGTYFSWGFGGSANYFADNVGIGTSSPSYRVHAVDTTPNSDLPAIYGRHAVTDFYGVGVRGVGFWKGVEGTVNATGSDTYFGVRGSATTSSGSGTTYGIYGNASGGANNYAGYFNGAVKVAGTVTATALTLTSDSRFKKNVFTIENALEKVAMMRGVSFDWRTDEFPDKGFRDGSNIGLIAQEVEEVLPQVVSTSSADGSKSVEYSNIVGVLVEAIKELKAQNEQLKDRIEALENSN